jgi:GNAT superfamily N-acetyltransferase
VQEIAYSVRAPLEMPVLQDLFVRAWDGHRKPGYEAVLDRAFTWVSASDDHRLVGFVNVAWDGGVHFFLLDTTVDPSYQRKGIGTALVRRAIDACRGHGEWMHVDSDAELMERLYFPAGFAPANAGTVSVA